MHKYARRDNALNLRGLRSGIKSAYDEVKADRDARRAAVRSAEEVADMTRGVTLDDFGGRSDALGG
jgi:hypothetical protein